MHFDNLMVAEYFYLIFIFEYEKHTQLTYAQARARSTYVVLTTLSKLLQSCVNKFLVNFLINSLKCTEGL